MSQSEALMRLSLATGELRSMSLTGRLRLSSADQFDLMKARRDLEDIAAKFGIPEYARAAE